MLTTLDQVKAEIATAPPPEMPPSFGKLEAHVSEILEAGSAQVSKRFACMVVFIRYFYTVFSAVLSEYRAIERAREI
jgi:hypothetical protein